MLLSIGAVALSEPSKNQPHIGYLYPAGAQRGTSIRVTVGGQFLRGPSNVYVSGEGVTASVIEYIRPVRNLNKEQRDELQRQLSRQ